MKRPICRSARRGHGLAPGARRPARRHVRARDQQGRLLRAGGVLPSPASADGLDRVRRAVAPARVRSEQAVARAGARRGRPPDVLRNAQRACALLAGRGVDGSSRAQRGRRRSAVRASGRGRLATATTVIWRSPPATTSSFRAARCGASRCSEPLSALLIEATNSQLLAARQGPARRARDLRSGDAGRAADGRRVRRAAERRRAVAGARQAQQRDLGRDLSVQSARCDRLARRPVGGAHQRQGHPAGREPSLSSAAVGAHDVRRPIASSSARSCRGRSRPIPARSRCRSSTTTTTTTK